MRKIISRRIKEWMNELIKVKWTNKSLWKVSIYFSVSQSSDFTLLLPFMFSLNIFYFPIICFLHVLLYNNYFYSWMIQWLRVKIWNHLKLQNIYSKNENLKEILFPNSFFLMLVFFFSFFICIYHSFIYLLWLHWVLVMECGIFIASCSNRV